jgi:tetratricopeptide (TPR) repeat protein
VKYPENVAALVLDGSQLPTFMSLPSRRNDFMSQEAIERINEINSADGLSVSQRVYNTFLNGDWKRQQFYRPSRERMAQIALYEWVQDVNFNSIMYRDQVNIDLRGAFESCPIPTIILDGKWDLIWSPDKPKVMHRFHPGSKLVMFEHSNHFSFQDEPERFFRVLQAFIRNLPKSSSSALISWKSYLANWGKEQSEFKRKEAEFLKLIQSKGIEEATVIYREAKRKDPQAILFREYILDNSGYEFLRNKRIKEAIEIFELNVEAYPQSYNVYDSLGEAYMSNGDKGLAVRSYQKSLELRPDNKNAAVMLKKLGD